MAKIVLRNELVEDPGQPGAYHKVNVTLDETMQTSGTAILPDTGKVPVHKTHHRYPVQHTSFAWKVGNKS